MNIMLNEASDAMLANYRLPRYKEIPDIGLYLEQSAKYINMQLGPLGYGELTTSMIGNYVKLKLISGPQKKLYGAEHIACLLVLTIMKNVLSIEDVKLILDEKRRQYTIAAGYDILCEIFEAQLQKTFGEHSHIDEACYKVNAENPSDGIMHNVVKAAVHKIYLDRQIKLLKNTVLSDTSKQQP